jgi:hypothetical protein
MLTLLRPHFPHRHNADGSHDSICTLCLATVATVQNELELAGFESAHVCEPANLHRASRLLPPRASVNGSPAQEKLSSVQN